MEQCVKPSTVSQTVPQVAARDLATPQQQFMDDALAGLTSDPKWLNCKNLYDARGSRLFDRICELEAYYPTRVESSIMRTHATEMGATLGAGAVVVELGSGSSTKTRLLLSHLKSPRAYLPVDISEQHLLDNSHKLQREYPQLDVQPVVADFTQKFELPQEYRLPTLSTYFPGSTIGNLEVPEAIQLLENTANLCGEQGGLLIGFDLVKEVKVLERAYNDEHGITAEFNLNLLRRMNRELDTDFIEEQFRHIAFFNASAARIEIYIESLVDQKVLLGEMEIHFRAGERMLTEYSHKYTLESFSDMALRSGLQVQRTWTDPRQYFAVMYLTVA